MKENKKKKKDVTINNLSDTEELDELRKELLSQIDSKDLKKVPDEDIIDEVKENKEITKKKNKPTPKKKENAFTRIAKGLSTIVMSMLVVIGLFLVFYIVVNKVSQMRGERAPLGLYTIISPSMTPKIKVYDVVFVVQTDPEKIQIGDVISYYSTNSYFGGIPITHRVIEKFNTSEGIVFRTQGDANPVADDEIILSNNVAGVVRLVIPQLGRVQFFLASKIGWIVSILIPALGVLSYDIVKLFKLIKSRNEINEVRKAIK